VATLKLKVAPPVFARLFEELNKPDNSLQITKKRSVRGENDDDHVRTETINFVRILPGERKFDGSEIEITLELTEEFEDVDTYDRDTKTSTSRKMIDQLLDLLGIFPKDRPKRNSQK